MLDILILLINLLENTMHKRTPLHGNWFKFKKRNLYCNTFENEIKNPTHLTHFHDIHLNESTHPIYNQVSFGQPLALSSIAAENNAAAQGGIREG